MTSEGVADLPESVAEIAEVIGREKALHLIGSLPQAGSRRWRVCVYIPKRLPSPDHQLVRILGWKDANRMVRAFTGMILQPSNCRFLSRRIRNLRIWEMAAEGCSVREIAPAFHMSVYQVRTILDGEPPEDAHR